MSEPKDFVCRVHIEARDLPHRSEALMERERHQSVDMARRLLGMGKGHSTPPSDALRYSCLEDALADDDTWRSVPAAFLVGRTEGEDEGARARMTELAARTATRLEDQRSKLEDETYVELLMSLALLGEVELAREGLRRMADLASDEGYRAAFYLAELGDPSGFPVVHHQLQSRSGHERLMAMRCLVAFAPFDGQHVGDLTINLRVLLQQRLNDRDPDVRVEVPWHMQELELDGLIDLLEPALRDRRVMVREAAREVLDRARTRAGL